MANLALQLETPVEQLVPALIAWNNSELLGSVKTELKRYENKVYDDSSIAEAKADRAGLKKFEDALNSERIRIKKIYDAPLDKFTAEVNEVINAVRTVSGAIDTTVKAYEAERKAEKRKALEEHFDDVIAELKPFVGYEKVHQESWLNTSVSITKATKEIDSIVNDIQKDIATIESLKSEDETTLKTFYFRNLKLSDAITQNELLKAERQRIATQSAKKVEQVAVEQPKILPIDEKEQVPEIYFDVEFRVRGTQEQLLALSRFMKENNINYSRI